MESPPRRVLTPLAAEALLAFGLAAAVASLLVVFGPPGSDLAAHVYQSGLFRDHGFQLWNNFWYEGRYSFVTYSLLYYPAASFLGIQLLAVLSIATAALAFTVIAAREWGPAARWSSRSFAVVWAGVVLSGAYPFALGATFALLALWALQSRGRLRFAVLTVLCFAASPLAFALLVLLLAAIGLARLPARVDLTLPAVTVAALATVWVVLWRVFPTGGRFPFSIEELAAVCVFCVLGIIFTWRVQEARVLRWLYVLYLPVCVTAFLIPSSLGENVARLRFAAVPLAILTLSLRRWRPLPLATVAFLLALSWNVSPLAASYAKGSVRSGLAGGLLGARDRLPRRAPRPVVPGRGGRHDGALGRGVPTGGRNPDHPRLVPAGGLPAQRGPLRRRRAGRTRLDSLAASDGRSLCRSSGRTSRLQLGG